MRTNEILNLMRVRQWYKNLLIFLPIIFTGRLFVYHDFLIILIGFLVLCFVSSSNYIINDILDYKRDRRHPEKRFRPIASGKIKRSQGLFISLLLLILSLFVAFKISAAFFYIVIVFFLLTSIYSLWLKNEIFVDVIIIGINFVLRAVSGAVILNVRASYWLIIGIFFFALFLAVAKREAEFKLLKNKAREHRKILNLYTPRITKAFMDISTSILIVVYSLYTFSSAFPQLIITLPLAIYSIFYYYYIVESGSEIARKPELIFKEKRMLTAMLLWVITAIVCIYFKIQLPALK